MLANTFVKVFQHDDGKTPSTTSPDFDPMPDFPWFDTKTIYDLLMKWPWSTSVTPDSIPLFFFQKVATVICGPLAYLFNQSLMYSEVPLRWKHAFVTPVKKKEPTYNPENYRPVSITSILCRLFEKVLKNHIISYVLSRGIVSQEQHGFVPGRSVESNLLECLDDWSNAVNNKHSCDIIYFDFAKAFDRVCHRKLLLKLEMLRVHPVLIKWIANYLSGPR